MKRLNLIGQKFGRLTVISEQGMQSKHILWNCLCDCGNKTITSTTNLRSGNSKSCSCLNKEETSVRSFKHGGLIGHDPSKAKPRLYAVWLNMKKRCYNVKSARYKTYGMRGITISAEFQTFAGFQSWALSNGYKPNLTIERKDINGNYSPENCTWISMAEQQRNTTRTTLDADTVSLIKHFQQYSSLSRSKIAQTVGVHPRAISNLKYTWLDIGPLPV